MRRELHGVFCALFTFVILQVNYDFGSALPNKAASTACDGEVGNILTQLRSLMIGEFIQAYMIPMTDAHQSEYIAEHDKRLQYVSKFTGSAGEGMVTMQEAAFWTDSRYFLQAEQQLNANCWTLMRSGQPDVPRPAQWLINVLPANSTVGVDPLLIEASSFRKLSDELGAQGHELVSVDQNLIDAIWPSQPKPASNAITALDIKWSGKESRVKIEEVMEVVQNKSGESLVITTLDDIAWLLNLRGSDIEYNPLFFSYMLLAPEQAYLFVDKDKLNEEARKQLAAEISQLIVRDYDDIFEVLSEMVNATAGRIVVSTGVSQAIAKFIPPNRLLEQNVVANMKSVKNGIEAKNMDNAHIRDGLALVQYLHWLNETVDKENVTELTGATKLTNFRSKQDNFRGISFEAISAVGAHAAMAHYSPSAATDKRITRHEIYLIDSGGHYWDGTTDVTRTVHLGTPTPEEKLFFTRVLKGFIALATSVFPKSTPLSYFDNVARRALWQAGYNYGHGTGHGVGMYLSVHEYPPLINSKGVETLQENVFTSNEPGYYRANEFGIRIEDVIQVIKSNISDAFDGQGALTFKSITYAPLQTKLMSTELLTKEEANFINAYNKRVLDTIGPLLLKQRYMDTYEWLVYEARQICSWGK